MIGKLLKQTFRKSFFPATKEEMISYAFDTGAHVDVIAHLEDLDSDTDYEGIEQIVAETIQEEEDVEEFFNTDDE